MTGPDRTALRVDVPRPDGPLIAAMGVLIALAALGGAGFLLFAGRGVTAGTWILAGLGTVGACALGAAFVNTWRRPMLSVRPGVLTVPTAFGARDIAAPPGHPLGEYLASSTRGGRRVGPIEANKFVHFLTLDGRGRVTELTALHRAAPEIDRIRSALRDVAGLQIETLKADPKRPTRPDTAHWRRG